MDIIVCGDREMTDGRHVFKMLDAIAAICPISLVIEGGQRKKGHDGQGYIGGVDFFAKRWAITRGIKWATVAAEWQRYGASAGPIRNQKMADMRPGGVVCFKGGNGTADMRRTALARLIPTLDLTEINQEQFLKIAETCAQFRNQAADMGEMIRVLRANGGFADV